MRKMFAAVITITLLFTSLAPVGAIDMVKVRNATLKLVNECFKVGMETRFEAGSLPVADNVCYLGYLETMSSPAKNVSLETQEAAAQLCLSACRMGVRGDVKGLSELRDRIYKEFK